MTSLVVAVPGPAHVPPEDSDALGVKRGVQAREHGTQSAADAILHKRKLQSIK